MTSLHIALQDGFKSDSVEIVVDGQKVYDNVAVTTNLVISLADSVDVDVTDERASVKINVRSRNITGDMVPVQIGSMSMRVPDVSCHLQAPSTAFQTAGAVRP